MADDECRCGSSCASVESKYQLVETEHGWAVERREDGFIAEFLRYWEADEAINELRCSFSTEKDYYWRSYHPRW